MGRARRGQGAPFASMADALRTATGKVNVSAAAAPSSGKVLTATSATTATWQTPSGGAPSGAAGGDLTGTYPNPTVAADAVTYAKMQNVSASARALGRAAGAGAGDVTELTGTQLAAIVDVGTASLPGVLKLGASGGAAVYRTPTQTLAGSGTMTADVVDLYVTAACTVTLPAVSASTIGFTTRIHVSSTTEIIVILDADGTDKIEGAAIATLIATRGEYTLTPTVAGRWALSPVGNRGICEWLHCFVDLTAAAAGSPWSLTSSEGDTTTWTDISSASSSWAASSGLVSTAKTSSGYTGAASADCAVVKVPIAELLDSWDRPLLATDVFQAIAEIEKTTAVGGSTPSAMLALAGTALSTLPRCAVNNSGAAGVVSYTTRSSIGLAEYATTTASFTAAGWLGLIWDGSRPALVDMMASTSPSGDPGVSGGWTFSTYQHADRATFAPGGTIVWPLGTAIYLHLVQTNTTTGSKFTWKHVAVIQRRGVRS